MRIMPEKRVTQADIVEKFRNAEASTENFGHFIIYEDGCCWKPGRNSDYVGELLLGAITVPTIEVATELCAWLSKESVHIMSAERAIKQLIREDFSKRK